MTQHISRIIWCLSGILFTSCHFMSAPVYPVPRRTIPVVTSPTVKKSQRSATRKRVAKPKVSNPNQTVSSPAQKRIRQREEMPPPPEKPTTPMISVPKTPEKKSLPLATSIPGRPGYVYNPYNNNPVFIQGIPSGKTVRDPKDPNPEHKFKVP